MTVSGTWHDMGYATGRAQRADIRVILKKVSVPKRGMRLAGAESQLIKYVDQRAFDFLLGLSHGADQELETLVAIMSWEHALQAGEHCSTVLGEYHGQWFIGHNEDDSVSLWGRRLYLIKFRPRDGVGFEALQYAGQLPGSGIGVNQKGFAVAMDNIWCEGTGVRIGWPISLLGLRFLQSRSWQDVIKTYQTAETNRGMHFLIVEKSKRAISCEFFFHRRVRKSVQPGFAHTNHALLAHPQLDLYRSRDSKQRLNALSGRTTYQEIVASLKTPTDKGGAQSHPSKTDDSATLATCIVYPSKGKIQFLL